MAMSPTIYSASSTYFLLRITTLLLLFNIITIKVNNYKALPIISLFKNLTSNIEGSIEGYIILFRVASLIL